MFEKYNAALRGGALAPKANQPAFMQANFEKQCKGNRYPTSLHLISSGIMKLGKLTTVGYGVEINSLKGPWGSFQGTLLVLGGFSFKVSEVRDGDKLS